MQVSEVTLDPQLSALYNVYIVHPSRSPKHAVLQIDEVSWHEGSQDRDSKYLSCPTASHTPLTAMFLQYHT